MVCIIPRQEIRSADYIRLVKPAVGSQFALRKFLYYVLGQHMQVSAVTVLKCGQCHRIFGAKLYRLVIQHGKSGHGSRTFFHESGRIVRSLKSI